MTGTRAEQLTFAIIRFAASVFITAIGLLLTAWLLQGMAFVDTDMGSALMQALAAAILIGLFNLLLRPIVLAITRPLGFFLLFLVGLVLNVLALYFASYLLPGFEIPGFLGTLFASIVLAIFNVVLTSLINLGEDDSFYRRRIASKALASPFPTADEPGRKLVMLEIDGLSYHHMKHAIEIGRMPALEAMIAEEGYVLSRVDCGIPSQTSACQAGIMFGDNDDIPAFRWFDKTQGKLIVSSSDAAELNGRYAHGKGLMRGGSSISNMLNGDAYKSLMTAADLRSADKEEAALRADDVSVLLLDPTFLLNMIARYLGMVVVEVWEGLRQRRLDVVPRLNRLKHFYPFVRAATSVALRDLGANFAIMDILRGSPSIYVTWPGYDEVAHHSGPWTEDAFADLTRYDKVIARVRKVIKANPHHSYDLIILSDHGQSFGPTFLQRYGYTIKEFIERQLPEGMSVSAVFGGDTGATTLNSASVELAQAQSKQSAEGKQSQLAQQSERLAEQAMTNDVAQGTESADAANVTAYGSGNLAQVYFDLFPRKITISELNAAYPGVVDSLVQHEGIGMVCGYLDDGTPIALGKGGSRNLHTGEIVGTDPLLTYAPAEGFGVASVEKRAWQTRRVMDFAHAGDLMVISTVYEDGTVAALEELIGSHGGLGGEQTDAFIFHPPALSVTDTRNSIDVFTILNSHRGTPVPPAPPQATADIVSKDFQPRNLAAGLAALGVWLPLVVRCIIPRRSVYRQIVDNPLLTGPAVLLGVLLTPVIPVLQQWSTMSDWVAIPTYILGFFVGVLILFATGYFLSRKGSYSRTLRAAGFAHSPAILALLALYPPIREVVLVVVVVLILLGVWMGVAEAHGVRGRRALVLPVVYLLVETVAVAAFLVLASAFALSLASLLSALGA